MKISASPYQNTLWVGRQIQLTVGATPFFLVQLRPLVQPLIHPLLRPLALPLVTTDENIGGLLNSPIINFPFL